MSEMKPTRAAQSVAVLGAALLLGGCAGSGALRADAEAGDYLLTVTRPGHLQVIDAASHKLLRRCDVPGRFGSGALAPSPDGRRAYVLSNAWEDVVGFDLATCEVVFSAKQSAGPVHVKSFQSIAVSPDGKELYTVKNAVEHKADRMQVLEPQLAVYNIADGLGAKPVRSFPVPRRITKIAATGTGEVILGGADLQAIDVHSGAIRTVSALASWERGPGWAPPDAFAMHSQGEHVGEYVMPYVTAQFKDDKQDPATADWWWGMSRVDLATGKAEQSEIFPFEFIVFTIVSDPRDRNIFYGAFNTVSKHDVAKKETLAKVDLDRTYYAINISRDGRKLYIGGGSNQISVHDSETLAQVDTITLSGDMATSDLRIAHRGR